MPGHDTHSPAQRPGLIERSSSSQSLSKGSPTAGALSRSHKGSSHKLHKAHTVGHVRNAQGRVPSYGKGLNKLSRLGVVNAADGNLLKHHHQQHQQQQQQQQPHHNHTRSASNTPSTSPSTTNFRKSTSHVNLPRVGSKVSMKKSHSHVTLSRNGSTTKLGNKSKSEKTQVKNNLRKKGTDDTKVNGPSNFEVGEDGNDDEWTEDSSSPFNTRQSSANTSRPKTPVIQGPQLSNGGGGGGGGGAEEEETSSTEASTDNLTPSLQDSSDHQVTSIHQESPPPINGVLGDRTSSILSHPPDAEAVTNRLLNRKPRTPVAKTSNISASITPPISSEVQSLNQSDPSINPSITEPSMPADGISRFLDRNSTDSVGGTPGSVSYLQSNLANLDRNQAHQHQQHNLPNGIKHRPGAPNGSIHNKVASSKRSDARRVKSAANLTHSKLHEISDRDITDDSSKTKSSDHKHQASLESPQQPSPFESARGIDPTSTSKSLTQLKLDLQRLSTQRSDPPNGGHMNPLFNQGHGGMLSMVGLGSGDADMSARVGRQWEIARKEVEGGKKFWPDLIRGRILEMEKSRGSKQQQQRPHQHHSRTQPESKSNGNGVNKPSLPQSQQSTQQDMIGRGRVRFEVGVGGGNDRRRLNASTLHANNDRMGYTNADTNGVSHHTDDEEDDEAVEGLLRRLWVGVGNESGTHD